MKKYLDESLSAEERAEALTDEMTTEEQASQLRYDAPAIERLGIPAYNWWNEGIHGLARSGVATMFPQAIGLAAMFDDELTKRTAEITSEEARAKYNAYTVEGDRDIYKGLTLWAPNINIFRDPRWGRGHETFGEDPYLTAQNGKAVVRGLQGDGKVMKAAACAKHFAVHSGPEALRHSFDAKADAKDMEETYLPAFEALVKEAKVESVMGAYNRVNGEPACASDYLMEKLKEWEFDGYFVSDCWAIRDFHEHHMVTANAVESAAMALKAGCDVNCGCTYQNLLAALDKGLITKEQIRTACVHLMRTRIRLGMFDKHTDFDDIPYSKVACAEHKAVSLECAEKSLVLLKNNGILPLDDKKYKTIAVIGPNADSRTALEGNYNGLSDRYTTFLNGIQDRFEGRVIFAEGCHLYKKSISGLAQAGDRYAEAVAAAKNADLVIMCVGLDATIEGEEGDTGNEFSSGDKNGLTLPPPQKILVEKIMSVGKPVVTVVCAGSAINTESQPDALIHAFYPGAEGGKALAEVLFGDVSPSGKLPVTFYEDTDKLPEFTDYSMKGRTYRYTTDNILFPFGYGLTYGGVKVNAVEYKDGKAVVSVENSGRATEDVIELYLKDYCEQAVPNVSLCGFKRVKLGEGEKATVEIAIPEKAFTAVDNNGVRKVFGSKFTLLAGTHQPDALSEKLTGAKCVSTEINK
ncbi:glycoside hydrolase family 3 C-terminal domain-containing protein [Ruminococcus albus]|uniref:glycoside hydrolase family 3 C-terminal domain-containing protein n=1 Tax=Ruminococcus albus TaxID=1264 RepID=UPI001D142B64|nr:glycoside hydrolase family 3 C-terminal domain-containing protein [Ruminococcus albus]MCC3350169.1 glycoside hydrolase family 3 C-terminal domain-containing protein [Ruminococcus albus 8]